MGVEPPVRAPLHDAARALQFVRSKAEAWEIDKERIAACGSSAGACSSLWLAFHDDLADPASSDPVARESTRLATAAVFNAQTTLDPAQMRAWTPNSYYGGHAFGFVDKARTRDEQFAAFLAARDTLLPWIAEYSPDALVTADDPPVYLLQQRPCARAARQGSHPLSQLRRHVGRATDRGWRGLRTRLPGSFKRPTLDCRRLSHRSTFA